MTDRAYEKYRVKAYCKECNRYWTTKAKEDSSSPSKCKYCESTKVKTKSAWGIEKSKKNQDDGYGEN